MRLLLIGQAPSRETDGLPPFVGRCGGFLAGLMGTTQERMLQDHDFMNVLDRWPGRGINGDLFPLDQAKRGAAKLIDRMVGRTVVLLGSNVARAFGVTKFTYFTWYEVRHPLNAAVVITRRCMIMPHPSGVNRHWNLGSNRERAARVFWSLLENQDENSNSGSSDVGSGDGAVPGDPEAAGRSNDEEALRQG